VSDKALSIECEEHGRSPWRGEVICAVEHGGCGRVWCLTDDDKNPAEILASTRCICGEDLSGDAGAASRAICPDCFLVRWHHQQRELPPWRFPVLWPFARKRLIRFTELACPRFIAWSLLEPHRAQAMTNHSQSLEGLAARGGLSAAELVAVLEDRPWHHLNDDKAIARLQQLVQEARQRT